MVLVIAVDIETLLPVELNCVCQCQSFHKAYKLYLLYCTTVWSISISGMLAQKLFSVEKTDDTDAFLCVSSTFL